MPGLGNQIAGNPRLFLVKRQHFSNWTGGVFPSLRGKSNHGSQAWFVLRQDSLRCPTHGPADRGSTSPLPAHRRSRQGWRKHRAQSYSCLAASRRSASNSSTNDVPRFTYCRAWRWMRRCCVVMRNSSSSIRSTTSSPTSIPKALRKEDGITTRPFSFTRVRASSAMAPSTNDIILSYCHKCRFCRSRPLMSRSPSQSVGVVPGFDAASHFQRM